MKASEEFQKTITVYIDSVVKTGNLSQEKRENPKKSMEECCNFILNTVKESGCNGFADEEIYGIALHYWDEDELDPKYLKKISGNVVVNHQIELTDEDKAELEKRAKDDYYNECLKKQREKNHKPTKKAVQDVKQLSLF